MRSRIDKKERTILACFIDPAPCQESANFQRKRVAEYIRLRIYEVHLYIRGSTWIPCSPAPTPQCGRFASVSSPAVAGELQPPHRDS